MRREARGGQTCKAVIEKRWNGWGGWSHATYAVSGVDLYDCYECWRVVHWDEQLERPSRCGVAGGGHQPRPFRFPRLYQSPVNPDRVTHDLEPRLSALYLYRRPLTCSLSFFWPVSNDSEPLPYFHSLLLIPFSPTFFLPDDIFNNVACGYTPFMAF